MKRLGIVAFSLFSLISAANAAEVRVKISSNLTSVRYVGDDVFVACSKARCDVFELTDGQRINIGDQRFVRTKAPMRLSYAEGPHGGILCLNVRGARPYRECAMMTKAR